MCGEVDERGYVDEQLFDRFVALAGDMGVVSDTRATAGPLDPGDEESRAAYMDTLFRAGLKRALDDAGHMPEGDRMDVVAGQAIVFARLAGFLAAQLPPEADVFRTVLSSLMEGNREPEMHSH